MVLSHLQNERETERKEKSQLLEHRCTVMVRSGCWSACLNSEGSHHGRSRGLPRHRVHWFPSQGPMCAWLITRTTCRYSVTCLLPVWQNPRHVGPTDLLLRMSLHAECELSLPDFFTMFLCTSPFGLSCLSDVNIITCRKTQIFEVSLMLISSGAEKQESLNFIWG